MERMSSGTGAGARESDAPQRPRRAVEAAEIEDGRWSSGVECAAEDKAGRVIS